MKEFKFITTLILKIKKIESDDETEYSTFYSSSKAEAVINDRAISDGFESVYITITSNIQKSLWQVSNWIQSSVNISLFQNAQRLPALNWKQLYQTAERIKPSEEKNFWLIFKILMIMNALNGVWSDTYNPADHNQVRIRNVKHFLKKCNLTLKRLTGSSWPSLWVFQNCIF